MSVQRMIPNGPTIKLLIMGFITLILLLPLARVEYLIAERRGLQYEAQDNIAANWGNSSRVQVPVLAVTYTREVPTGFVFKDGHTNSQATQQEQHTVYVPAEEINVTAKTTTEMRHYGIYELPVYLIDVDYQGFFSKQTLRALAQEIPDLKWDQAELVLPVVQPRSLRSVSPVNIELEQLPFNKRFNSSTFTGLSTALPIQLDSDENIDMDLTVTFAGSKALSFQPMAGSTQVAVQSDWPNPSFDGAFLPAKRTLSDTGFSAQWSVMDLNLNLPSWWQEQDASPLSSQSAFGFKLYQPVDVYQQNMRSIKYAILVIVLSFLLFFLLEIYLRVVFHPIQYVMVGIALSLFYLLLVAFSEHLGFTKAYMLATAAVVIVVGWYSAGVLKSYRKGLGVAICTVSVYAFLFFLIRSQDYALVIGASVLFLLFSCIMIFSRHLDWYQITQRSR